MLIVILLIIAIIAVIVIRPYTIKYDTVIAFTGGLGTGKSFESVQTALVLLRKARIKTALYNIKLRLQRKPALSKPLLYSSIPVRISRKEMSVKLTPDMLTLQSGHIKGSVVFTDEIDVFANQFAFANQNIIEIYNKKELSARRNGDEDYDSGLFDEYVRLFRHLWSSEAVEAKFVCNSQSTQNITTIVRRRMNTVYVLSNFRKWKLPVLSWFIVPYTVKARNITITDEITNTAEGNTEDNMRVIIGIMPRKKRYDTHCYKHRSDTIPFDANPLRWSSLTTERLMKAPITRLKNKSKQGD